MEKITTMQRKCVHYTAVLQAVFEAVHEKTGRTLTFEQYVGYDPRTRLKSDKEKVLKRTLTDLTTALTNLETEYERIFKNTLYENKIDVSKELFDIHAKSGIDPFKYRDRLTIRDLCGATVAREAEVKARKYDADNNY